MVGSFFLCSPIHPTGSCSGPTVPQAGWHGADLLRHFCRASRLGHVCCWLLLNDAASLRSGSRATAAVWRRARRRRGCHSVRLGVWRVCGWMDCFLKFAPRAARCSLSMRCALSSAFRQSAWSLPAADVLLLLCTQLSRYTGSTAPRPRPRTQIKIYEI